MAIRPRKLAIYRTSIPMRSFQHAAARRDRAEAVVVRLELSDGSSGWGETLPRPYVTGETLESVTSDLAELIWPKVRAWQWQGAEDLPAVPMQDASGRCINAAACAMEIALLWASAQSRGGWGAIQGLQSAPAARPHGLARVTGVLGSADPGKTARRLGLMRLYGLRDFKLKLGLGEQTDAENLRVVSRRIGKAVARGKCTLRVDVNGGWTAEEAPQRIGQLEQFGVTVIEQPIRGSAAQLADLAERCTLPLMADESLLGESDARRLLQAGRKVWWNIRLSKNGGIRPALALARLAEENDVPFVIGCMVGESSILSAAQRRLLEACPPPRFLEGNYGRFLLADDLTDRSLRFGYGGRLRPIRGNGIGVTVKEAKLRRYGRLLVTLTA